MKNRLLTSVTALMLTSMAATSQIMHAVVFCDTDDAKIGKAVEVDHDNLIKELECYATFIDYDICLYEYSGEDCCKGMLLQALDELEIAPEDIVVFCYSGHGTRAMNNENDPFPQMCLGSSLDSEFVPLQFAINKLNAKNPKLLVSFTNCCNKESDMVNQTIARSGQWPYIAIGGEHRCVQKTLCRNIGTGHNHQQQSRRILMVLAHNRWIVYNRPA